MFAENHDRADQTPRFDTCGTQPCEWLNVYRRCIKLNALEKNWEDSDTTLIVTSDIVRNLTAEEKASWCLDSLSCDFFIKYVRVCWCSCTLATVLRISLLSRLPTIHKLLLLSSMAFSSQLRTTSASICFERRWLLLYDSIRSLLVRYFRLEFDVHNPLAISTTVSSFRWWLGITDKKIPHGDFRQYQQLTCTLGKDVYTIEVAKKGMK